jgi:hypothetical protein
MAVRFIAFDRATSKLIFTKTLESPFSSNIFPLDQFRPSFAASCYHLSFEKPEDSSAAFGVSLFVFNGLAFCHMFSIFGFLKFGSLASNTVHNSDQGITACPVVSPSGN